MDVRIAIDNFALTGMKVNSLELSLLILVHVNGIKQLYLFLT